MLSMDLSLLPSLLPHSLATLSNSDLTELPKSRCISNNFVYQRSQRDGFFKPFLTTRSLNDLPSLSTSTTRKRLKDAGRSSTCDDPTVSTTRAKLSIHQVL